MANQLPPSEVAAFDSALRLYFTTAEVREKNFEKLSAVNQPVKVLKAVNKGRNAQRATEDEANNLAPELYLCISARVMLTANLWTEAGLVNGSMGTVYCIEWARGQDTSQLPSVLFVKFDNCTAPEFPGFGRSTIPIFPAVRQFDYQGVACSRIQFPLRLAFAITVHKSQGLTLNRVVLDLNKREHCLGLAYVATSRVKHLNGLLFEGPFDFERFAAKESITSLDRQLDFTFRSAQLV